MGGKIETYESKITDRQVKVLIKELREMTSPASKFDLNLKRARDAAITVSCITGLGTPLIGIASLFLGAEIKI